MSSTFSVGWLYLLQLVCDFKAPVPDFIFTRSEIHFVLSSFTILNMQGFVTKACPSNNKGY